MFKLCIYQAVEPKCEQRQRSAGFSAKPSVLLEKTHMKTPSFWPGCVRSSLTASTGVTTCRVSRSAVMPTYSDREFFWGERISHLCSAQNGTVCSSAYLSSVPQNELSFKASLNLVSTSLAAVEAVSSLGNYSVGCELFNVVLDRCHCSNLSKEKKKSMSGTILLGFLWFTRTSLHFLPCYSLSILSLQ